MKKIIINADDFGADSNINAAITFCFKKKIINSATMMVNTKGFEEAVKLAHQHNFTDKIGLHLNLTSGRSLTDLSRTGLTDQNGFFIKKPVYHPKIFFSEKIKRQIKNEVNKQYYKLLNSGIMPTHLDSHHQIHIKPWIAKIFLDFTKSEKQKIRIANDRFRKNLIILSHNKYLNIKYKRHQINFSDKFEKVHTFLKHYNAEQDSNLNYEIMVHPVFENGVLIDNIEKVSLEKSLFNLKKYLGVS